jgi:hypothetical protein
MLKKVRVVNFLLKCSISCDFLMPTIQSCYLFSIRIKGLYEGHFCFVYSYLAESDVSSLGSLCNPRLSASKQSGSMA